MQRNASSRSFGLLLSIVLLAVGAFSYRAHGEAYIYFIPLALAFVAISLFIPRVLAPLKRLWLKLGMSLSWMVTPVVLGLVYVLSFIPVGALIRVFGKDLLSLKLDPRAPSYWIGRDAGGPAPGSLKDQF